MRWGEGIGSEIMSVMGGPVQFPVMMGLGVPTDYKMLVDPQLRDVLGRTK